MENSERSIWYKAVMGNDSQGLIIDEKTGKNIAVSYDKKDAYLIAAAPDLLQACNLALDVLLNGTINDKTLNALYDLKYAISKAEGK